MTPSPPDNRGSRQILFVDDDRALLDSFHRLLRGKFELRVAESGREGLALLAAAGPFAVVVTDLRMPIMDGISLLAEVQRKWPDTMRIILTGHADLETAIRAVNDGQVFRFLTKPCQLADLEKALFEGLRQYQLVQTEREYFALLKMQESLTGVVHALARMVELTDPLLAEHQERVARLSEAMARKMDLPEEAVEEIFLAASVHDIGKIYAPVALIRASGEALPGGEDLARLHPRIGHDLLAPLKFPFAIHQMVLQHHERLDGSGRPQGLGSHQIMPAARIIAVADAAVNQLQGRVPGQPGGLDAALAELRDGRGTAYDPLAVDAALALLQTPGFELQA